jgi:hypothetical protein
MRGAMALALVFHLSAGCSLFFAEPPPKPPKREPYVYCNQSQRLPTLDGLLAALATANLVVALSREDSDYAGETLSRTSDMVLSAALATLFAISSGVGSGWVQECRAWSKAPVAAPLVTTPRPPPAGPRPRPADDGPIVAPVDPEPPDGGTP